MVFPERKQIQARLGEAQKLLEAMNGFREPRSPPTPLSTQRPRMARK
jgi:hypothetical protein